MTPLERAARALAKAQSGVDEFDALDEAFQETLKENARAVIEAYEAAKQLEDDEFVVIPRMKEAE